MELGVGPKLRFYLFTLYYGLGKHGVLGLTLLVLTMGLFLVVSLPQEKQLSELKASEELDVVEHKQVRLTNVQDSSLQFFKSIPSAETTDKALESIVSIASEMSLSLDSGQYETNYKERAGVVLFQVEFPLKGSYAQVKQFLAKTLNTLPNAALTKVSMRRSPAIAKNVEADVVFMLYFKKVV